MDSSALKRPKIILLLVVGICLFLIYGPNWIQTDDSYTHLLSQQTTRQPGLSWNALLHPNNPFSPVGQSRKLRILHLTDYATHTSIMDRWFARSQAAFAAATEIVGDAPLWGQGFPGYRSELSLIDNMIATYGSKTYFDAILLYLNTDQIAKFKQQKQADDLLKEIRELASLGVVIIDRPHEMRAFRREGFMRAANITLTLCPYPNECWDYREKFQKDVLLAHQPHPVNRNLFYHPVSDENGPIQRPHDVLLAGSLSPEMYPLRNRLWHLQNNKIIKVTWLAHPGYPDLMTDEEKASKRVSLQALEDQLRQFGDSMAEHKICLVTASRWGYSLQKFGEAAMAGCLIIGTVPFDRFTDFEQFVVPISNQDSDERIAEVIQYWLTHDKERLEKVNRAQQYFLNHFTDEHYARDVTLWIRLVQRGQRGLVLPHEFKTLPDPLPDDG